MLKNRINVLHPINVTLCMLHPSEVNLEEETIPKIYLLII